MYELTSLLTTMSAGSASFVAILGGLIAQKVIEINNGRAAIEEEIKELNEQKEFQQKEEIVKVSVKPGTYRISRFDLVF